MYQLLTEKFNRELAPEKQIPPGRIISSEETVEANLWIRREGLKGGAVWYDGFMPNSHRILIGVLRWACEHGAVALNYCRAEGLLTYKGQVVGLRARELSKGTAFEFKADVVINAAGPWCREVASRFDRDIPSLFNAMVAWNVLYDRPAPSSYGIALSPPCAGGRTFFLVPWQGRLLAGTGQAPWTANSEKPLVSESDLDGFCRELNSALPSINLKREEIVHVYSGLQSAKRAGGSDFTHRDVIVDHSQLGGPKGLYSISGIKFTTARLAAERTLNWVFSQNKHVYTGEDNGFYNPPADIDGTNMLFEYGWQPSADSDERLQSLRPLIDREAVEHLDDLVVRRSNLGDNPARAMETAGQLAEFFDWEESRKNSEIRRLNDASPFFKMEAKA